MHVLSYIDYSVLLG